MRRETTDYSQVSGHCCPWRSTSLRLQVRRSRRYRWPFKCGGAGFGVRMRSVYITKKYFDFSSSKSTSLIKRNQREKRIALDRKEKLKPFATLGNIMRDQRQRQKDRQTYGLTHLQKNIER